ncbi:unnamed protein product [Rotaria magnacalcarata]|uniref:Uncharacterized protein n=1 Tax=Rotaria magnacalcarata TaxID=392030 RepID=A0A816FWW2_9BILA|nr:unnamed protein product [Rotaria magnacalcarata]CAF1667154.1 unnamed protein product [Rotaria magnacalcarata]CAF1938567.1 unnamed protein product [Rotaria magnacalcarata]CAF4452667.1 unnamed protein product [Rotaria magnacalcarata]CAF4468329.1 unnamed protein product [Rotaria magnacalcarata]
MAKTSGSQDEIQPINDHGDGDFGYWYNEMNSDDQFVRYMTEIYKKQHLNIYMNKQQKTTMTHHTRSNTQSPSNQQQVIRQLPQLMDHPITFRPYSRNASPSSPPEPDIKDIYNRARYAF